MRRCAIQIDVVDMMVCVYAECPLLVVTGPTSLVSSSSFSRLSDAQRPTSRDHTASTEVTSYDDDTQAGAVSDGEIDLHAPTTRRIGRSRFTVAGQV